MSIADKITSMTNHLEKDYQALESVVGTVSVNKNIENIAPLLDNLWEELPKVTGSGTSPNISDTRAGKMKLYLSGNTSQETTTGANVFDLKGFLDSKEATYTKNSDSSFTITALGSLYSSPYVFSDTDVSVALSGIIDNGTATNVRVQLLNSNNEAVGEIASYIVGGIPSSSYIENKMACKIRLNWSTSGTFTLKNIMVNTGGSVKPYEEYTGKVPAPNPNFPYPVHIVSGDNNIKSIGKNLAPSTIYNDLDATGSATLQENGYYEVKFNGNKTIMEGMFKENTQYTISCMAYGSASGNNGVLGFNYTDGTSSTSGINQTTPYLYTITSTSGKTIKNIKITYGNQNTTYVKDFQIELGTTATAYVTPQSSTYPINLPVENLFNESQILNASGWTLDSNGYYTGWLNELRTYMNNWQPITYKANTQYTFSYTSYGDITTGNGRFVITYTDSSVDNLSLGRTSTPQEFSFTSDAGKTISEITVDYSNSHTIYIKDIQLQEGSKANSYTPYGTTPIELNEISTYKDRFIINSGKQVWDEEWEVGAYAWATGEKVVNNQTIRSKNKMPIKPSTTYYVTIPSEIVIEFFDSTDTFLGTSTNVNKNSSSSFTTPSNASYFVLYMTSTYGTTYKNDIMINEGSTALPYEPYGSGDWYLKKEIGTYTFDGTESWSSSQYGTNSWVSAAIFPFNYDENKLQVMSNTFRGISAIERNTAGDNVIYSANGNFVIIRNTTLTSLAEVRSATNGSYIFYALATPTYTKITDNTLIEQLNAVYRANSYKGQTNISQVNNDLPFELDATALEG